MLNPPAISHLSCHPAAPSTHSLRSFTSLDTLHLTPETRYSTLERPLYHLHHPLASLYTAPRSQTNKPPPPSLARSLAPHGTHSQYVSQHTTIFSTTLIPTSSSPLFPQLQLSPLLVHLTLVPPLRLNNNNHPFLLRLPPPTRFVVTSNMNPELI